jgi:transcriptional regulator with XRE-family HTH domain
MGAPRHILSKNFFRQLQVASVRSNRHYERLMTSVLIRKLKDWRAVNNLSQSEAARALAAAGLPIALRTLQQWEIGSRSPHAVTAAALERFLSDPRRSEGPPSEKTVAPVILRLKAWREANKLSQAQAVDVLIAAGLPAKLRTVQDWESGRRSPHAITAAALARFLGEHPKVDKRPPAD